MTDPTAAARRADAWLARLVHKRWLRWSLLVLSVPTLLLVVAGLYGIVLLRQNTPVAYADVMLPVAAIAASA